MSVPGAIHCGGGKRKTRVTGFDWVVVKALLRPMGYGGQPSPRIRLASRSLGEGWWRRRESNP